MDKNGLIILITDVNAQMDLIKTISERLKQRAMDLTADDIIRLESVAYQIHNLYNATEDLFKIIATYFENNISDTTRWHSALLQRMTQSIPEIRPALFSQKTYSILNSLRGFRHFFRHAYGSILEYEQLKINLDKAMNLYTLLETDVNNFIQELSSKSQNKEV